MIIMMLYVHLKKALPNNLSLLKLLAVNFITVCARLENTLEVKALRAIFLSDRVTLIHVCSNLQLPMIYVMYYRLNKWFWYSATDFNCVIQQLKS